MYILFFGVAEQWISLIFNFYKVELIEDPSDDADMSNEKAMARLKLMVMKY